MRTLDDVAGTGIDAAVIGLERLRSGRYLTDGSGARTYQQRLQGPGQIHWHEFYEVFVAVSGTGAHIANGLKMPIVPGTVALLTPADFHQVRPDPEGLQLLNVAFTAEELHDDVQELLLSTLGPGQVVFKGAEVGALIAEFGRLWIEQEGGSIGSRRILQGALERILIEFCRRKPTQTTTSGPHNSRGNVQRAIAYLHHNFREPLTLATVASQGGLSRNYFSESFHRATGTRFNAYLRELRLRFARSLLQASDLAITEIAHASGFATLSHFERSFKQAYGVSPSGLRLLLREAGKVDARGPAPDPSQDVRHTVYTPVRPPISLILRLREVDVTTSAMLHGVPRRGTLGPSGSTSTQGTGTRTQWRRAGLGR
jgi:AraC-like DNA-binding protein